MQRTHAATHSSYSLELLEAFEVEREGEAAAFTDVGNRQLLWHGSRLTNWCGILSQGLRIAPPEAPVTGYMFGKGVYFADMVSKSANYCFATGSSDVGVISLSEVALGGTYDRLQAEYSAAESCKKAGKHATWGKGKTAPDPAGDATLSNDVRRREARGWTRGDVRRACGCSDAGVASALGFRRLWQRRARDEWRGEQPFKEGQVLCGVRFWIALGSWVLKS